MGSKNTALPSPFPIFSAMGRVLSSWPAHGEKKGAKVKGIGALHVLCAQDSVFRIATSPMHIVIVFFSGGLLPQPTPPDLCALHYICTCLFALLIWVPDCCGCLLDKKDDWILHMFAVTQS